MKNRKQPELRFDDFSDEWKIQVLRDVVERVTRKNKELQTQLPLTISAQYGLVDQISYFNKQVASKDMSNYFLLKRGEFAYNKSYSRDYPWGAIKRLEKYDMGALSSLYITFKPLKIDSNFLVSYYDTKKWHKEVSTRATEGARNHGLLNISANDFLETEIVIPLQEEQEKIGSFFKHIDEIITLKQQELDTLKQTKQGFLQKMFPKEGENAPEIRFSGFNNKWEARKLKNIVSLLKDGTHGTHKDGEFAYLLSAKNIKFGKILLNPEQDRKIAKTDYTQIYKNYELENEDLLVTIVGTIGQSALYYKDENLIAFQRSVSIIRGNENISQLFLKTIFDSKLIQKQLKNSSSISAQPGVYLGDLEKMTVMLPELDEQIKIGAFFRQLDKTIELHEKELEALKETKKAFLQKMFV